jgi:hypothetical protein
MLDTAYGALDLHMLPCRLHKATNLERHRFRRMIWGDEVDFSRNVRGVQREQPGQFGTVSSVMSYTLVAFRLSSDHCPIALCGHVCYYVQSSRTATCSPFPVSLTCTDPSIYSEQILLPIRLIPKRHKRRHASSCARSNENRRHGRKASNIPVRMASETY